MTIFKDFLTGLSAVDKEKQVLKAFSIVTNTFAQGTGRKTVNKVVEYRQAVEETTGLSKQILLNRAITDLASTDGRLLVIFKKLGTAPLASFSETEADTDMGWKVMLMISLNLDTHIEFNQSGNFNISRKDAYSVTDALIEGMVVIYKLEESGQAAKILRRNEHPDVLGQP